MYFFIFGKRGCIFVCCFCLFVSVINLIIIMIVVVVVGFTVGRLADKSKPGVA